MYVGFVHNEPIGIVVAHRFPHPTNKNIVKIARVVVLPHWQGYGVGMKMVEELVEKVYPTRDIRFTTTLPIIHSYLWGSDKWLLKSQGIRRGSQAGKNAKMAGNVREVYMETYQYVNGQVQDTKITRSGCPKDKRKVFDADKLDKIENRRKMYEQGMKN